MARQSRFYSSVVWITLAGMVASVEIKTGQKTVLDYLIKPLNKVKEALRER